MKGIDRLVDTTHTPHDLTPTLVKINQDFSDEVMEFSLIRIGTITRTNSAANPIPNPLSPEGALSVPRILKQYEILGETGQGKTNIKGMFAIMYTKTGLDVNDSLEVFGSVTEVKGFRKWVSTAGNFENLFKGKYFEAWYAKNRVGPDNIQTLNDVIAGKDAIDIITKSDLFIELKNVRQVLTSEGVLDSRIKEQIERHFKIYGVQEYKWIFSKNFESQQEKISEEIVQVFLNSDGFPKESIGDIKIEFENDSSTIPF